MSGTIKGKESWSLFKTAVTLTLVVLCVIASDWQYTRGVNRAERNDVIEERISRQPTTLDSIDPTLENNEWQSVSATGRFDPTKQILLRNRYSEGKFGFELLTLFTSTSEKVFWVNRGWVEAGANAVTAPETSPVPTDEIGLTGRFRLDSSLTGSSFFYLSPKGQDLVPVSNPQNDVNAEKFYIDLVSSSNSSLIPASPVELPPLSDGPHKAYALQWLIFGGLVIYGRVLIRRTR